MDELDKKVMTWKDAGYPGNALIYNKEPRIMITSVESHMLKGEPYHETVTTVESINSKGHIYTRTFNLTVMEHLRKSPNCKWYKAIRLDYKIIIIE